MQFGIREICDVVFKAKSSGKLGKMDYVAGQPVLYIDTAKTSTLEGAATSVYATGGRGNTRLITWEGEKTLTFTVEDALLSPIGFAMLSGAGLLDANNDEPVYVHVSSMTNTDANGKIDLQALDILKDGEVVSEKSPIFIMKVEDGSVTEMLKASYTAATEDAGETFAVTDAEDAVVARQDVFVDFYVEKKSGVQELTIDAENFAGNYYVEASTLFRRRSDGKDLPAELVFPNVKIQSNFTFSMASTGDPSTFTFTMDAMPGYTRFDRNKKVLCAIQIVNDDKDDIGGGKDSVENLAHPEELYPTDDLI